MSATGEVSVFCVNAVVYEAQAGAECEWRPLGGSAWSEMHLFKDDSTGVGNYRVVAWIPDTTEVILNVNILDCTQWSVKSEDFAELANPSEPRYGIYFPDQQLADTTTSVISKTIEKLGNAFVTPDAAAPPPPPAPPADAGAAAANEAAEEAAEDTVGALPGGGSGASGAEPPPANPADRRKRMSLADFRGVNQAVYLASSESGSTTLEHELAKLSEESEGTGLGRASIVGADGAAKRSSVPVVRNEDAEAPPQLSDLKHQVHVSYNEHRAAYEGLPDEWQHMNQQFGVAYPSMPKSDVEGYDERIPSVLVMMKRYLSENNARDQVGIFRLAPDKDDCNFVKEQINSGKFEKCSDVNIVANLIKVWFRDMPSGLYNTIDDQTIYRVADMQVEAVPAEYHQFHEPHKSLILWLLDLMAEFVVNEGVNKMSAKNMSIVMSPNLYQINAENPMTALTMAQKVADFTTKMLAARLMEKWNYDARIG